MPPEPPSKRSDAPPKPGSVAVAEAAPVGRGGHRVRVDLTTGSIPKKLFGQAWPQVIEGVLNIADEFVDLFWAGRLPAGFRAIASVGVAQTITGFAGRARQGFDVAMRAMIARAVGARDIPLANHILFQALCLTGIYSVGMILVGVLLTSLFLSLLGVSDAVRAETTLYMQITFIGSASQSLRNMTGVALQAAGEPLMPMRATAVTRVIHVVLSPFFIFGWWLFPEMGLPGSALATVLAQFAGIAINLYGLTGGRSRLHLGLLGNRLEPKLIWKMVKTGTPASVRGVERGMSQVALLGIVAPFGDVALAGYALSRRLEMLVGFGSGGLAQAAGVIVGQNLGAGFVSRAKQAVGWALLYVASMKIVIMVVFWAFTASAVLIFSNDPDVVDLTSKWIRIQLFAAFSMGLMIVFQEAFNGAGDTLAPMVLTLAGVWAVEVPLAWFLCTQTSLGPLGIAWAAIGGFTARLLFSIPYYFHGRWLRVKVL